jgi:outer membrane protein OmpA-like peptidoglycan-associated protein
MNAARRIAFLTATVAAILLSACGPQQVRAPKLDPKTATLVVLMPDPDGGATGRATVSNKVAATELIQARESTLVALNLPPSQVTLMSEDEVKRQFGALLSSLPPAPQQFTLFFRFESDELTAESRALVPEILRAVKGRPVPEVIVTGHTDTTGTATSNFELGLKRADVVRTLLVQAGFELASIEVTSHGEAVLLVPTADDTYEPRNRRVDITIR